MGNMIANLKSSNARSIKEDSKQVCEELRVYTRSIKILGLQDEVKSFQKVLNT